MKAMSLTQFGLGHVESVEIDKPIPGPTEVLVKVLEIDRQGKIRLSRKEAMREKGK